jgi:hypothetical protein
MTDKVFCGNAKVVQTKYGEMVKISFSKKDLQTMMDNLSESGWINTVLKEKKEKIEGKPTHYLEVDNYKPTPVNGLTNGKVENDLPF